MPQIDCSNCGGTGQKVRSILITRAVGSMLISTAEPIKPETYSDCIVCDGSGKVDGREK